MTASLTLTGSVAALAAALQAFEAAQRNEYEGLNWHKMEALGEPDTGSRSVAPLGNPQPAATPATPSTDTGAGIPQPMPTLSVPSGAAPIPTVPMPSMSHVSTITPPIPTGEDDEEDGADTDGSGTDAEGLPWDARIHSSSKKKTDKGLWAARRGGPKGEELAAIKDELRGVTQVPMPLPVVEPVALTPVPMPPPVIEQPVAAVVPMPAVMPPPVPMPQPVAAPAPEPVAAPLPLPTAAAPAAAEEWDFAKLMAQIGPKMGTTIDPQYLAQVCQHYGIGAITDTATKPELIGQLVAQFKADGRW